MKKSTATPDIGNPGPFALHGMARGIRLALAASAVAVLTAGPVHAQVAPSEDNRQSQQLAGDAWDLAVADPSRIVEGLVPQSVIPQAAVAAGGDISVVNKGKIDISTAGQVIGLQVSAPDSASVRVTNRADITATSTSGDLADGIFASGGQVTVDNSAAVAASGYSWVTGVEVRGAGKTQVTNSGDVSVVPKRPPEWDPRNQGYTHAYGIYAAGGDGGLTVNNKGTITADRGAYYLTGIHAYNGGSGGIKVSNSGDIRINDSIFFPYGGVGNGILAATNFDDSDIDINNTGHISARSLFRGATAIGAITDGQDSAITIRNSGDIFAEGLQIPLQAKYGGLGIAASGNGDVTISNVGAIRAHGAQDPVGIFGRSYAGDVNVSNSGLIDAHDTYKYGATGISVNAVAGKASVRNSGVILVASEISNSAYGLGIQAQGAAGVTVQNSGRIDMTASGTTDPDSEQHLVNSKAMLASSSSGDVRVDNTATGKIDIVSSAAGFLVNSGVNEIRGIKASTEGAGNIRVGNAGEIELANQANVISQGFGDLGGIAGSAAGTGNVALTNSGQITANSVGLMGGVSLLEQGTGISTFGLSATTATGIAKLVNSGRINLDASVADKPAYLTGEAAGLLGATAGGTLDLRNSGTIQAASQAGGATGISAQAVGGNASLTNTGTITVDAGLDARPSTAPDAPRDAIGLRGVVSNGTLTFKTGAGSSIKADATGGDAIGVLGVVDSNSSVNITTSGAVTLKSDKGRTYAVRIMPQVSDAAAVAGAGIQVAMTNTGNLLADVAVDTGSAALNLSNRGVLEGAINAGGGSRISNGSGGSWQSNAVSSRFGAGNNRIVNNAGGAIALASSSITLAGSGNQFTNNGLLKVSGNSVIDLGDSSHATLAKGSAAGFINNGLIDFANGNAGDTLTIGGSFGGRGDINVDVSLGAGKNDLLNVTGSAARDTKQRINVALADGLPKAADVGKQLQVVRVSGDAPASAFAAGRVLGVSQGDFVKLGLSMQAQPDSTAKSAAAGGADGGSAYTLQVQTKVDGLTSAGVLASSVGLGVDSLMSSSVGNWRDRTYSQTGVGANALLGTLTPWVRGFNDQGGMSPDHLVGNFGGFSSARLNQNNSGTEFGLEYRALNGLKFGMLASSATGSQRLMDDYGYSTLRGNTLGLYGTWTSPAGFFVDASWRSMQFDANMNSGAGNQRTRGNATTTNVEAGYTTQLAGLTVEPSLRYTQTSVGGLQVQGDTAQFRSEQTSWQHAQAGVSLSKSFAGASGWLVTPYGEFSAVRTMDGVANYAVNADYFGSVSGNGTRALVKLGLAAQNGRFAWGGGVNWIGAAAGTDGDLGGQLAMRYAW